MEFRFAGEIVEWRGPAPHWFVVMPEDVSVELHERPELSYGWGCIPAQVTLGETVFTTSLMPRQGRYLVPMKAVVRGAARVGLGESVALTVRIDESRGDVR